METLLPRWWTPWAVLVRYVQSKLRGECRPGGRQPAARVDIMARLGGDAISDPDAPCHLRRHGHTAACPWPEGGHGLTRGGDASVTLAQWLARLLLAVAAISFAAGAGVGWCTAGCCIRRAPPPRARALHVPAARTGDLPPVRSPLRHRSRSADAAPSTVEAAGWRVSVPGSLGAER